MGHSLGLTEVVAVAAFDLPMPEALGVHTAVFDLPMSKLNWKYISLYFSAPMQAGTGTSNEPSF